MRGDALAVAQPVPVLRMLGWCAAGAMILAALFPQITRIGPDHVPVTLEVRGDFRFMAPEAVRLELAGQLDRDFYELDLVGLRQRVERLPWVSRARVERVWPGTVRVDIDEHQPYARWGKEALLSQGGVVFTPGGEPPDGLPLMDGPEGRQQAVRIAFEALRARLAQTPFVPVRLTLSVRGEWLAWTVDGIELRLGRSPDGEAPLAAAATLAGPVRRALEGRLQEVSYVDLHYIHGFAIGWRVGAAGNADSSPGPEVQRE